MNITRQEAIKLLLGTAALAVVPSTVKAIDISPKPKAVVSYTPTTADILKHLDTLLNLVYAERGEPYDDRKDNIDITVPCGCDAKEVEKHFIQDHPHARWYGSFDTFQSWKCLLVRVNRFENPEDDGRDKIIDSRNEVWARMVYTDEVGVCRCGVGRYTFCPPPSAH